MPAAPYHGWTHRPAAQGGTDPIPGLGTAIIPFAGAFDGLTSQSFTDPWVPDFDTFLTNDATTFSYENTSGSPAKFRYIGINQDGLYLATFRGEWVTDFTDQVYVQPQCESSGSPDSLINFATWVWTPDYNTPVQEQFIAAEWDHHAVVSTVYFTHEAADDGENPLKIGLRLVLNGASGTKQLGANMTVMRLGDVPAVTTSF
jgi:hypothetical protein